MTAPDTQTPKPLRADARRNRERIIAAARAEQYAFLREALVTA